MKHLNLFIISLLCFVSCVAGTSSTVKTFQTKSIDNNINDWYLGFIYEAGIVEEKTTKEGSKETTIKKGFLSRNLQLLDDIYFNLIDMDVKTSKKNNNKKGKILIHPHFNNNISLFGKMDVRVLDSNDRIMYRLLIKNEFSFIKHPASDEAFAKYSANEIYKLISKKVIK